MERFHRMLAVIISGMLLMFGSSANAQLKDSPATDGSSVVHPAAASQVIAVAVKELRHGKSRKDQEYVVAQAVGFTNDTCDVVTTFDVVKMYEERQNWRNVRQRIDIVVDGKSYPAKFRDIGFYPLGLNLACIDFESPIDRAAAQISILPLDHEAEDAPSLSYDDGEIAKSDPGTPFLNQRGEISSVLIASPNGPLEFATAAELRLFLKVASTVSPWPTVHRRSLSSI